MRESQRYPDRIEYRREVKGPVAAFDRVAEAAERTRGRLTEYAEVDEVAMHRILRPPEGREQRRVEKASQPEKAIAHALLRKQRAALLQIRPDKRVDTAVEHRGDVAGLDVRSMVLHELIGLQHVRAYLRSPLVGLAFATYIGELAIALLGGARRESSSQDVHRHVAVLRLRSLLLRRHDSSGGLMDDADGRLGLVDV